jgi:acetylornithine deacetylase
VATQSAVDAAVLAAIDEDALIALASDLVAIPSVSGEETPAQDFVAARLRDIGARVEQWTIDMAALSDHPAYSAEVERDTASGVVARVGEAEPGAPVWLLDGHVDVVPPGAADTWAVTPPFTPRLLDGALYGRGACDTKGGVAAAIHALDAIARAGVLLRGEARLTTVIGEEDGGSGTLATLLAGAGDGVDACVVLEPTELSVVPAVAGALSFRIRIRGLAAHGAMREEGVSAIEKLPVVQAALIHLEQARNEREADPLFGWLNRPFAICAGRLEAGDWPSSEADWLSLEGRYGVGPDEDLDAARRELEDAVAAAATTDAWLAEHPPTVEWWGGQFVPGRTGIDETVVTTMVAAATDATAAPVQLRGMPYGCDMGLTTRVGHIPTVVFGPGDIRTAHRPDEHVAVADLVAACRTLALALVRGCDGRLA